MSARRVGAPKPPAPPAGLEAEETQARGFGRVREAHAASHVTAVKAVARLEREGLAISQPHRGVKLTEEGEALAGHARARHRLVLDLLLALGVPAEDAKADAEGIEHHVSPATLAAFARFLKTGK